MDADDSARADPRRSSRVLARPAMNVLVTGGTGYLGRALVEALAARGHELVIFGRSASRSRLPGTAVDGDIRDREALERAAAGCDAISHSAALVSIWRRRSADFDEINVGGLRNVIDVAASLRIPRIVYTSSFLALPPSGRSEPLEANDYQRTKVVADRLADAAVAAGCPMVRVYPGVLYGPGSFTEGNLVGRLISDHLRHRLPGLIGPEHLWSYAYLDDVAAGAAAAIERGRVGARYALGGENVPQSARVRDRRGADRTRHAVANSVCARARARASRGMAGDRGRRHAARDQGRGGHFQLRLAARQHRGDPASSTTGSRRSRKAYDAQWHRSRARPRAARTPARDRLLRTRASMDPHRVGLVRVAAARAHLVAGRGAGTVRARVQPARPAAGRRPPAVSSGRRSARLPARHSALSAGGARSGAGVSVATGHRRGRHGESSRSATAPQRSSAAGSRRRIRSSSRVPRRPPRSSVGRFHGIARKASPERWRSSSLVAWDRSRSNCGRDRRSRRCRR